MSVMLTPGLRTRVVKRDAITTVFVAGEIDQATAGSLWGVLEPVLGRGWTVVIDMADVTFVGAAAVTVLVRAMKVTDERHQELQIRDMPPGLRRILSLTGNDLVIDLTDGASVDNARTDLASER